MNKLTLPLLFSLPALGFAAALPLANPGFENSTDEWSFGDAGMSSVSDKAARSGEYGLLVEDQSGAKGSSVRSARLPVEPGKSYQVDFSAKIIGGGGIAVYLEFYDAKGKALTSSKDRTQVLRVIPPQLDGWKEYSVAGTAPEGTATVAVWVHSFSGNTVTAAFDDFSVQEVPASAVKEHPSSQSAASKSAAAQPAWTGRSEDLPSFEKKDPAAAFPEMKVYQPDGSAFRQPKEDWEQARQKVKDDPEWAKWYAAKKKEVDAWMAHNKDRAEWEAGWNHEFISPHDNAFLVWTDRVPGEEVDHFMSKTGDRVEITPKLFRAWVGAFRKNHASMMIEAGMLYRLTQDEKYAEWVAAQLDFYADNYMAWEKGVAKRANSWLGYQSLDDAVIISRQADAARLVFDYAGKDRRQNWYENLFKPEAILLGKTFQNIHNIATWQRATQVKIALLYGDKELLKESMDGGRGLRQQFERGVTGEYVWYEQSMGYNGFIIMATESLFTTAALIGEGDAVRREAEIAENLMLAPLSIRFPDGTIPNPADNTGVPRASVTGLAQVYRILPTWIGLVRATTVRNWDTLVDPPEQIADLTGHRAEDLPEVISRNMESTRFAILKEGPWQVFFHYGQLNRSHSQAEALNWSASYGDVMISRDFGTVAYGSPASSEYYRQGLAQNVPLIDGNGQAPWHPGKLLAFDAEEGMVEAEQTQYRPNATARRKLRIEGDTLIDEVSVKVTEGEAVPLGLALHLLGEPELSDDFKAVPQEAFTEGRPVPFKYWKDVKAATFEDFVSVPVAYDGGLVLDVEFKGSGPFTLYVGQAPGQPPATHTAFFLDGPSGHEANWIVRMQPHTDHPEPTASPEEEPKERSFWQWLFGS